MSKKFWLLLTLIVTMALVLAACSQQATAPEPKEEPAAEEPAAEEPAKEEPAAEEPAKEEPAEEAAEAPAAEEKPMEEMALHAPPGGFLERAMAGEFSGTTVTVDGPFVDTDEVKFNDSMKAFEDATGIDIQYIGSKEFEASISVRVDAGDAPDIADFPQPGLAASFVQSGDVVDISTFIPEDWLKQQYNQSWLDMATIEGPDGPIMAGAWGRYFGKSIVYYPKKAFEASGYEIPQTWDELMALTQQIADDGDTAWCIGIESGAATGWAATRWTEEASAAPAPHPPSPTRTGRSTSATAWNTSRPTAGGASRSCAGTGRFTSAPTTPTGPPSRSARRKPVSPRKNSSRG